MRVKITLSMEASVISEARKRAGLIALSRWIEWVIKKELGLIEN